MTRRGLFKILSNNYDASNFYVKTVNDKKPLFSQKSSIIDVSLDYKYHASKIIDSVPAEKPLTLNIYLIAWMRTCK